MATIKETGAIRLCEETNMAKRKPKQPITALWLLEHADSPGNYVIAMDGAPGYPDDYLVMSSLKTAKALAKNQADVFDVLCVPVKFDVVPSA